MERLNDFPEHLNALFKMLETNRARLEADMMSKFAVAEGAGFNEKHALETRKLAEASHKLGVEIRAWLDSLQKATGNLGQQRKLGLMVDFIQSMPASVRYDTYDRLMGLELKRTDGIKISVPVRMKGSKTNRGSKSIEATGRLVRSGNVGEGIPQVETGGDDSE